MARCFRALTSQWTEEEQVFAGEWDDSDTSVAGASRSAGFQPTAVQGAAGFDNAKHLWTRETFEQVKGKILYLFEMGHIHIMGHKERSYAIRR